MTFGGLSSRLKARSRFARRVREVTSRSRGVAVEKMLKELKHYVIGWLGDTETTLFPPERNRPVPSGTPGGVGPVADCLNSVGHRDPIRLSFFFS